MSVDVVREGDPAEPAPAGEQQSDQQPEQQNDQRTGRVFQSIAVFGVVAAVVSSVVAWRFLSDLDRSVDQSLRVGEDAAVTLSETIDVADDVIVALDAGLTTIAATLGTVDRVVGDTSGIAASVADLAATLPESFDDIDAALATVESIGGTIDDALRTASRVPLGPDYDPDEPFPDAVANLRAAFEPIGTQLEQISVELASFAEGSADLAVQIDRLGSDLDRTRAALADSAALLDDYRATANDARELAASSRADFARSIGWARLVVVLLGVLIALGQYLPWWLGVRLGRGTARRVV